MSALSESNNWTPFRDADFPALEIDSSGKLININSKAASFFGFPDLTGISSVSDLLGSGFSAEKVITEAFRKGASGIRFQVEIKKSVSTPVFVEFLSLHVPHSDHRLLICNDLSELQSVRDQLSLSENRFRELINNSSLGLLEVDVNEIILYANDSFCRLTGYTMEEIVGKHAPTLLIRDETDESESMLEEVREKRRTGISDAYELRIRGKQGQSIWVLISGAPVFDNFGKLTGSVGIHHDITLQKEEAEVRTRLLKDLDEQNDVLQKQQQHLSIIYQFASALLTVSSTAEIFRLIYKVLPGRLGFTDCIVYHFNPSQNRLEWDLRFTEMPDPFPVDFNPEIIVTIGSGITGTAASTLEPLWIKDTSLDPRYIPDRYFFNDKNGLPVITSDKINNRRSEMAVPVIYNGELFAIIDAGNPAAGYFDKLHFETLVTLASLTATRIATIRQGNALIESERRLRQVIDSSLDAVFTIDQQFIVTEVNSMAVKLFQMDASEMTGSSFENLFHPVFFPVLRQKIQELSPADSKIKLDADCIRDDGSAFLAEVSISVIFIRGQLFYSAFIRDITVARKAEKDLINAFNREAELNSLKTRFITLTSHEFRTPLTTIQTSTELLEMSLRAVSLPDPEKFSRYLFRIYGEVGRLTGLMNDILVIGRIEAGRIKLKTQRTDLVHLVGEMLDTGTLIPSDHRKIALKISGNPVPILCDPSLMTHVFQNLLTNALKYSAGEPPPEIVMEFLQDRCRVSITDYGIGIPEEERAELFNTFFRASNAEHIQGTGLGLTIVKQFLELHGTTISVNSTENRGSTFSFDLSLEVI